MLVQLYILLIIEYEVALTDMRTELPLDMPVDVLGRYAWVLLQQRIDELFNGGKALLCRRVLTKLLDRYKRVALEYNACVVVNSHITVGIVPGAKEDKVDAKLSLHQVCQLSPAPHIAMKLL